MPPFSAKRPSPSVSTTSLAVSSFHERRQILEEEHKWLLKQIKRKRTELKKFLHEMRSLATEIFQRGNPLYKKLIELDTEIHGLFEDILTKKKFGKKSQKDILGVYHSLQYMGLLSPKFDEDDEDEELDDVFNNSSDEFNPNEEENFFNKNAQNSHQENFDDFSSERSEKSPESRQIRQTFLKLASMFHPDKVMDSETKMHHNEIMKELNRAYQEGDIARLLEIERQHHLQEEIDMKNATVSEIERLCLQRERDNQLLKNQYETLKKELRIARNTPEGEMVKDYRACQKEGIDAIGEILSSLENQVKGIENIRDFVQNFRDKKITLKQFLQGPSSKANHSQEKEEEMLEMLLEELLRLEL
ncbi:J domain-containing protein [Aphanothece sacrum]|uniref:Molecular chaperone DnaJ n=1 Tax=Aphanothece sacrum FPU1 TaxID=1920663 RepID=A0A401IET7_APHSA|nr:J domain-containing protein [Aphanothece sacrum]GBF79785.1 molecular chaperone DnaJ [Aphanothece sacrum FPU1]GBF84797.1 molecular chaperone DnaJ [Aphanothece sacrum FPU3]